MDKKKVNRKDKFCSNCIYFTTYECLWRETNPEEYCPRWEEKK